MTALVQTFKYNKIIDVYYISNSILTENTLKNIDSNAIGYIEITFINCDEIIILNMHVNEPFRGHGYGRMLLKYIIDLGFCNNVHKITLDDMSDRAWSNNNIYLYNGFHYIHEYPYPEMELNLDPHLVPMCSEKIDT